MHKGSVRKKLNAGVNLRICFCYNYLQTVFFSQHTTICVEHVCEQVCLDVLVRCDVISVT